jgi:hypothetical protein
MRKRLLFCLPLLLFFLSACVEEEEEGTREVMGLRPVYGSPQDLEVRSLPPQDICQPGKIYVYGSYLLVSDVQKGIHIIDNTNPAEPRNLSFIRIAGNVDMAIKDGFLYADHITSMVIFDITDPTRAKFVRAVEKAFDTGSNLYPHQTGVSFECVDPGKGTVIGWTEALLKDPQCFR